MLELCNHQETLFGFFLPVVPLLDKYYINTTPLSCHVSPSFLNQFSPRYAPFLSHSSYVKTSSSEKEQQLCDPSPVQPIHRLSLIVRTAGTVPKLRQISFTSAKTARALLNRKTNLVTLSIPVHQCVHSVGDLDLALRSSPMWSSILPDHDLSYPTLVNS